MYRVRLEAVDEQSVSCEILERCKEAGEREVELNLAVALTKGQRFDFMVEKSTEIGIASIRPLLTARVTAGLRAGSKIERWQRLSRAAAKQSGRSRFPVIEPAVEFDSALETFIDENDAVLLASPSSILPDLGSCVLRRQIRKIGLMIGPEGGFDPAECERAQKGGATLFSWGPTVMRTDTAGVVLPALVFRELEKANEE